VSPRPNVAFGVRRGGFIVDRDAATRRIGRLPTSERRGREFKAYGARGFGIGTSTGHGLASTRGASAAAARATSARRSARARRATTAAHATGSGRLPAATIRSASAGGCFSTGSITIAVAIAIAVPRLASTA
jgi:hypothetical protein